MYVSFKTPWKTRKTGWAGPDWRWLTSLFPRMLELELVGGPRMYKFVSESGPPPETAGFLIVSPETKTHIFNMAPLRFLTTPTTLAHQNVLISTLEGGSLLLARESCEAEFKLQRRRMPWAVGSGRFCAPCKTCADKRGPACGRCKGKNRSW